MTNDPEQQLYEDIADLMKKVSNLRNENRALKTKLTKLSNRVESIELLALQDQISTLNDEVKSNKQELQAAVVTIRDGLIDAQRSIAGLRINTLTPSLKAIIERQLPKKAPNLLVQLFADAANAKSKIDSSNNPPKIANQFKDKWQKLLQELGLELGSDFIVY